MRFHCSDAAMHRIGGCLLRSVSTCLAAAAWTLGDWSPALRSPTKTGALNLGPVERHLIQRIGLAHQAIQSVFLSENLLPCGLQPYPGLGPQSGPPCLHGFIE